MNTIYLNERLTSATAIETQQSFLKFIYENKKENIILDFEKVKYIDSIGIGIIKLVNGHLKAEGRKLNIINCKKCIYDILANSRLQKEIEINIAN